MKNTLLCTTTLAMTGFAGMASAANIEAGALNVGIGGYFTQHVAAVSVSGPGTGGGDFDGVDLLTNAEIHFAPSLTLDNGITIGAQVELEAISRSPTDRIDESYMWAEGSFGRIVIGSENSAGYTMHYAAPDVSSIYANSTSLTSFIPFSGGAQGGDIFRGTLGSTYTENARNNDAQRITYFTPRFSGIQLGVSYARDAGEGNGPVNNNAAATDFFDIGANYVQSFGAVDLALSGRYGIANGGAGGADDPEIFGAGINLGYAGFTFGASYSEQQDAGTSDGEAFDVGVSYANGPMSYSFTFVSGENLDDGQAAVGGTVDAAGNPQPGTAAVAASGLDETLDIYVLAVNYRVADNFNVGAYAAYAEFEDEANSANDVDGTVIGVSASFSF